MALMSIDQTFLVGRVQDIADPGSREFLVFASAWSLRGFVVRKGESVFAYLNRCPHAGFPLNRSPDGFLGMNNQRIMCRSHGAMFEIESGICVDGICIGQSLRKLPIHVLDGIISVKYDELQGQWI